MQLTRKNFGDETLVVMDQVAQLLYLAEQALELIRTFENNPHKGAVRTMRVIVEFANKTSSSLMEALFHTENKRSIALIAANEFALGDPLRSAWRSFDRRLQARSLTTRKTLKG